MSDPSSLRAVLDVMDRADTLDVATPVTLQQRLVDAALAAGATQSATALQRAAADHLNQIPSTTLAAPTSPSSYAFGWERPRNPTEQQAFRRRPLSRLTRWVLRWFGQHDPLAEVAPAPTGQLDAMAITALVAPPVLGVVVGLLSHTLTLPALLIAMGWGLAIAMATRIHELSDVMVPPMDPVFIRACLLCDEARHYLKACLESDLPLVLQGDRNRMEKALQRAIMQGYHHAPPTHLTPQEQADLLAMFNDVKEHTPD